MDSDMVIGEEKGGECLIRILCYNTHVCIKASRSTERLRNLWKHVLPSRCKLDNLYRLAGFLSGFDVAGLQESDGGSLRSYFRNHTRLLALLGGFGHWAEQVNRDLYFARHSIGFLSRFPILDVRRYRLPGRIPGRGLLVADVDVSGARVAIAVGHLSLGPRDRVRQMLYIGEVVSRLPGRTILMGDFNCTSDSEEMRFISARTGLRSALDHMPTYPSWRPERDIDHVLVSEGITIRRARTLDLPLSDHLPVAVEAVVDGAGGPPAGVMHLAA